MKSALDWRKRAFYLSCLIVVPFLNFLAWQHYGIFYPETAVGIALLILASIVLALIFRGRLFYALIAACMVFACSYPLFEFVRPVLNLHVRTCVVLVAVASAALVSIMRERFLVIMAVFAWSGLAATAFAEFSWPRTHAQSHTSLPDGSVLWIVLDEEIGLAGFPDCPACQIAKRDLTQALSDYNFTVYANAYSNYTITTDSLPSILNQRLLTRPGELISHFGPDYLWQYRAKQNLTSDRFRSEGLQLVTYQYEGLRWCDPAIGSGVCRNYSGKLARLTRAPGPWTQRFAWLVGEYQGRDPVRGLVLGFFPVQEKARINGALNLTEIWPDGLANDIVSTPQRAFFFVHLLTPHAPYFYRPDGSLRPYEQWARDRSNERVDSQIYSERYVRYCEQVQFVAHQLRQFLDVLKRTGALEHMTVVVQGDHGSRIRRILQTESGAPFINVDVDKYDYTSAPPLRDLLDRFSALLAIHKERAQRPEICYDKHSELTLLLRDLYGKDPADGVAKADLVYLIKNPAQYQSVDILSYWRN